MAPGYWERFAEIGESDASCLQPCPLSSSHYSSGEQEATLHAAPGFGDDRRWPDRRCRARAGNGVVGEMPDRPAELASGTSCLTPDPSGLRRLSRPDIRRDPRGASPGISLAARRWSSSARVRQDEHPGAK